MRPKLTIGRVTLIVVVLFIAAGVLIVALDWHEMKQIIGKANWPLIIPTLLLTASSYTCLSLSLAVVFRTFGIQMKLKDLLEIGFVSNVVTFLMNVGGVTGVSLQFVLMKRRGLATEDILAPSLFQLCFTGLMLIALIPIGLFNVLASHTLSHSGSVGIGIAAGILTLLLVLASLLVFIVRVRETIFRVAAGLVKFIMRRNVAPALDDFNKALTRGVSLVRKHPASLVQLIALTIGDWASTVAGLWFCFYALGLTVSAGTLITGFSLGVTAGFISFIPGGLGVEEGSMAGIYALLGIPISTAVLAAILFRIVYYFLPFLASLGFYRRLLKEN